MFIQETETANLATYMLYLLDEFTFFSSQVSDTSNGLDEQFDSRVLYFETPLHLLILLSVLLSSSTYKEKSCAPEKLTYIKKY